jgi:predicted RNA-binding Zn-ribbon protein involved in translation (DUF1610 family)
VSKVLDPEPDLRFAPRQPAVSQEEKVPVRRSRSKKDSGSGKTAPARCTRCQGTLPADRVVKFCPQCGHNLTVRRCPECNSEVESSWRHCVECGGTLAKFA